MANDKKPRHRSNGTGAIGRRSKSDPPKTTNRANSCKLLDVCLNGEPLRLKGRAAQTLEVLISARELGFSTEEARGYPWARRLPAYVHGLMAYGFLISSCWEILPDSSRIARYRLNGNVTKRDRNAL